MLVLGRETRRERVPVARGFWWGGSKGNQERQGPSSPGFCWCWEEKPGGSGYLWPWDFGGGVAKETRRYRVPVARAFVGVRKRNQEGEGTCVSGIWVEGETTQQGMNIVLLSKYKI
jgi:hypothetical protein